MPFVEYKQYRPKEAAQDLIIHCNRILDNMTEKGYTLTLRQLYYQLVTENRIPNTDKSYDRLKGVVGKARDGGMIDWNHIQDRGRSLRSVAQWDDPRDFIRHVVPQFRTDHWEGQLRRVEVWVEKDALAEVVGRPSRRWGVPYFPNKGYVSASAAWAAGQRFQRYGLMGQDVVIIHLGDHDPSGIDMTRDVTERVRQYSSLTASVVADYQNEMGTSNRPRSVHIEVRRLALNLDQVNELQLQPNPTKLTDSRAPDYVDQFGTDSWELDAIPVEQIDELISNEIQSIMDQPLYDARVQLDSEYSRQLNELPPNWDEVIRFLQAIDYDSAAAIEFLNDQLGEDHDDQDD